MRNKKTLKLVVDETLTISRKKGNGILRRCIWMDMKGEIAKYSLAYINGLIFSGDNGRVLGYDNAHGYHHKHYLGKVTPVHIQSFEELEQRFQNEFEVLYEKAKAIIKSGKH